MTTPAGVTRRTCSLGTFMTNESGEDLGATITIKASIQNFVWSATGDVVVSDQFTTTAAVGQTVTIDLIPTDLDGWLANGVPISTANGAQTHTYTITIQPTRAPQQAGTPQPVGPILMYKNVVVPSGTGVLDVDLEAAFAGDSGQLIVLPSAALAVPEGGLTGQVLIKGSDSNYDTQWATLSGGTGTGAVDSVNGQTGVVTLTAADVGAVPTSRTVAGHALTADVTLQAADLADSTVTGRNVITAASGAAARAAIGAGTSNLTLGNTATTAKAGDYAPTLGDIPPGSIIAVFWDGTNWNYAGSAITARPTSRADITFNFIDPVGTAAQPAFAITGDIFDQVVAA